MRFMKIVIYPHPLLLVTLITGPVTNPDALRDVLPDAGCLCLCIILIKVTSTLSNKVPYALP